MVQLLHSSPGLRDGRDIQIAHFYESESGRLPPKRIFFKKIIRPFKKIYVPKSAFLAFPIYPVVRKGDNNLAPKAPLIFFFFGQALFSRLNLIELN